MTTNSRRSLVTGARAAGVAVRDGATAHRLIGALLMSIVGTSCSQLADLDGLSKNYGKLDGSPAAQDGSPEQASDRGVSTSDVRDGTTPDARDAPDQDDGSAGDAAAQDAAGDIPVGWSADGGVDGGTPDGVGATDGGFSSDAPDDGGEQMCESEAVAFATLELNTATPATTGCGNPSSNLPRFYVAVDSTTFGVAEACGACVRIQLSNAVVDALIVDLGSARFAADRTRLGVNKAATDLLLPDGSTFVADGVPWNYISCPAATTGMIFTIQLGSSTTYSAMLVQNHRYRLRAVEYKIGTTFKPLTRTMYNYWVASSGMGAGPYTLRLTDVNGSVVEQSGIPLLPGISFQGQAQFPICPTP